MRTALARTTESVHVSVDIMILFGYFTRGSDREPAEKHVGAGNPGRMPNRRCPLGWARESELV